MSFIEIRNLTHTYTDDDRREETIHDLSLNIEKGEFLALLGHNGSGKSTLAKLITGILEIQSGQIIADGTDLSKISDEDELFSLRRKIGMVFQNPDNQLVATVVEEDIAFGPENLGVSPEEIRRRVRSSLKAVGMLKYAKHAPHKLSGGQKQRIAIAGVLAMMPECIIFDEATAMLDPRGRADVMDLICRIHKAGITVVHITHNMNEALLADRVVVMNEGRIFLEGTPKEVFSHVDELHSVGLEAPAVTELLNILSKAGLSVSEKVTDVHSAARAVASLFPDMRRAEEAGAKISTAEEAGAEEPTGE